MSPAQFFDGDPYVTEQRDFAAQYATMAEAWDACPRAYWMMSWACRLPSGPTWIRLVHFALQCVEDHRTLHAMPDSRSHAAVRAARKLLTGGTVDGIEGIIAAAGDAVEDAKRVCFRQAGSYRVPLGHIDAAKTALSIAKAAMDPRIDLGDIVADAVRVRRLFYADPEERWGELQDELRAECANAFRAYLGNPFRVGDR